MKERFLSIFFIITLLSLSACSGTKPTNEDIHTIVPSPIETQEDNLETTIPSSESDDRTDITFAVPSYFKEGFVLQAELFHESNPDIVIQIVTPPEDFNAWTGTDLFTLASAADATYVFSNQSLQDNGRYFLDMQPLIDNDGEFKESDFWPNTLDACQDEYGKRLGMPLEVNLTGIAFDQSAFDRAGLPYPALGWTWSEFEGYLNALADSDVVFLDSQEFFASIIGSWADQADDPANRLQEIVARYLEDVRRQAIYPFDEAQTVAERQLLITERKPAMWSIPLGTSLENQGNDPQGTAFVQPSGWGFAPYPIGEDSSQTTPAGIRCGLISSGSQHPREAWRWLNYLSQHWMVSEDQSNYLQLIPARIATAEANGYWEDLPNELEQTIRFGLEHAWYGPSNPATFKAAEEAIIQVLESGADFQTAYRSAKQAFQARPTATPDSRTVVVAAPPPVQSNGGEEQITFFSDIIDAGTLKNLAAAFEDTHPLIQVEVVTDLSQYNFQSIAVENYTANFDCFTGLSFFATENDSEGKNNLFPLDSLLTQEPGLSDDFFPGQLDLFTKDGSTWGLPAIRSFSTLTYNVELLNRFGIAVPSNSWSFNDFINLINTVSSKGSAEAPIYGYAMVGDSLMLAGQGLSIGNTTPISSFRFDQSEIIDTVAWLKKMVETQAVVRGFESDPDQIGRLVSGGQIAFWDTSYNGWFFNGNEPNFPTGEIPLPSTPQPVGISSGDGYYISAQAKNPNACWDWITFLSSQPSAIQFWPVRKSIAESPNWQAFAGPENVALFQILKDQPPKKTTISPERSALLMFWNQAMNLIYSGSSPESELSAAQAKADGYFDCMQNNLSQNTGKEEHKQISQQCIDEINAP